MRTVILRWHETLPSVAAGEDIDILFLAEDEPKLADLLRTRAPRNGSPKFDVYSDDGTKGSDYRKVPYYERRLALKLIRSRQLYNGLYYAVERGLQFYSLAYHVLYHKGSVRSGIPIRDSSHGNVDGSTNGSPHQTEHNYHAVLLEMARACNNRTTLAGAGSSLTLERVHADLQAARWTP